MPRASRLRYSTVSRFLPAHSTVKEQEVDVVIIAIESNSFLTLNEGEAGSEFQDETLDLTEDGGLKIPFAVSVREL